MRADDLGAAGRSHCPAPPSVDLLAPVLELSLPLRLPAVAQPTPGCRSARGVRLHTLPGGAPGDAFPSRIRQTPAAAPQVLLGGKHANVARKYLKPILTWRLPDARPSGSPPRRTACHLCSSHLLLTIVYAEPRPPYMLLRTIAMRHQLAERGRQRKPRSGSPGASGTMARFNWKV